MESLNKDVIMKIALELSPPELINFCLTTKNVNICDNKDFWRLKIQKDYPYVFEYFQRQNKPMANPKNTYIRKFTEVYKLIEEHASKYDLDSKKIYKIYEEMLKKSNITFKNITFEDIDISFKKYFPGIDLSLRSEIRHLIIKLLNKDQMYGITRAGK